MSTENAALEKMLKYLASVPTGYVTDVFLRLGLRGWIKGLKPLSPFAGPHLAGPALTLQWAPIRGKKSPGPGVYDLLRAHAAGCVVVLAGGSDGVNMGDNMCTQAKVAGARGLMLDGALRDVQEIRELGMPVFHRYTAIERDDTLEIIGVNVPVICAGATIHGGDIVVADEDGGIVIPSEYLAEVVENVRDVARLEKIQAELIQANAPMDELKKVMAAKKTPIKK